MKMFSCTLNRFISKHETVTLQNVTHAEKPRKDQRYMPKQSWCCECLKTCIWLYWDKYAVLSVKVHMLTAGAYFHILTFTSPVLLFQTGCLSVSAGRVWPVSPPPSCPVPPSAVRGWCAVLGSVPSVSLFPRTSAIHQTSLSIHIDDIR